MSELMSEQGNVGLQPLEFQCSVKKKKSNSAVLLKYVETFKKNLQMKSVESLRICAPDKLR